MMSYKLALLAALAVAQTAAFAPTTPAPARSRFAPSVAGSRWGRPSTSSTRLHAAPGEGLVLTEENVEVVLAEAVSTLETMFDSPQNREVGITGRVEFVELDGPTVVLGLYGRFWHERTTVLARVSQFLTDRIPEIIDVGVEDPGMLLEENNDFEAGDPLAGAGPDSDW
mmetsp:Transcript_40564/g.108560  ORF Transcript_40564/g.108560 Transcript_40564/m.108560 type:complete len:169 (-) Transcript_40564:137-643(-)